MARNQVGPNVLDGRSGGFISPNYAVQVEETLKRIVVNQEYLIISDDHGIVATFRQRKGQQLTVERAYMMVVRLYPTEAPHMHEIYGPTETAPKGGRRVTVYLSPNPEGNGRIGRNWVDFIVRKLR